MSEKISAMTVAPGAADHTNDWFENSREVSPGNWVTYRQQLDKMKPKVGVNQIAYGDGATGLLTSDGNLFWDGSTFDVIGKTQMFTQFGDNGLEIYDSTLALICYADDTGLNVLGDMIVDTLTIGLGSGFIATNTAVGYQALFDNTTGNENVALGYQALKSNTTGQRNIAFGFGALTSNTTGARNVALGYAALSSNATSDKNVAFGYAALASHTTNEGNNAFGYLALLSDTTGQYNNAFGAQALQSNTTGNGNTAIGANALASNTTGSDNIAIGYGSQSSNNAGNNVTIGKFAMNMARSASQNVCIGDNSGVSITTGNNNTVIGYNASNSNLTTGSGNTIIGYNLNLAANANDNLIIGAGGNIRMQFDDTGALFFPSLTANVDAAAISTHSVPISVNGTVYNFLVRT